jgi:hypothetical protein
VEVSFGNVVERNFPEMGEGSAKHNADDGDNLHLHLFENFKVWF